MTMATELDIVAVPEAAADTTSYVDWAAIIGGIVLSSALSVLFLTFGSAVGLSFTNFHGGAGVAPIWIAIAAASWLLWTQVSSFMAGGYLAGRLRRRHHDSSEHEVDVRDGAHGLLVWGGGLIVSAIIAVSGVGAAASAIGSAAATLTTAASNVAGDAAQAIDPSAYYVDQLFRAAPADAAATPAAAADATATPAAPATSAAPATAVSTTASPAMAAAAPNAADVRAEAGRIFAQGAVAGTVSDADKAYLGQLVAQQTGLPADQATARVNDVMTAVDKAKADAALAADNARKIGVLAAFLTAASLLVSAVGAFWAAQKGGNHRDDGTAFVDTFRRL